MPIKKRKPEEQQRLIPETHRNHYLFSDYYLNELLIETEDWQKGDGVEEAFKNISELYNKIKPTIERANESQTEERFIKPILEILGHHIEVQTRAPSIGHAKRPDYAFFADSKSKEQAFEKIGTNEYFDYTMAIGDAKSWDRPLDKKIKTRGGDPFTNANPNYQMDFYLRITNKEWAILTNGVKWRLYNRESSYQLDHYYEIDLVSLLKQGKTNEFKYFYLFFTKEAFLKDGLLDTSFRQSRDFAVGLEENLHERAYEALLRLAKGFWEFKPNKFAETDLERIHDYCLIVLYQLLFVLNAECRGLLPISNPSYASSYSLKSIRDEIIEKFEDKIEFLPSTDRYWSRLKNLFTLVFNGSARLGITFFDGGLFDLKHHKFLTEYSIGDDHLAKAIDFLCRAKTKKGLSPIDYRDLGVRHLGGIYEGILEYKLQIAKESLVVIKEKDKEVYIPVEEARRLGKRINSEDIIKRGELYLSTDKGERKSTGSYFTPDYIVNYIVENTLGPLTKNKKPKEILELNILDPAMGSGHFLLGSTDFLAKAIHGEEAEGEYLNEEEVEDEINDIRRHVVERCINGVDVNPLAVELAKLTLWLHTMAKGKPLSFLDHNLKCGNSLIGAKLTDLERLPPLKKKTKENEAALKILGIDKFIEAYARDLRPILGWVSEIEYKTTDTIDDIKSKKNAFKYYETGIDKYRQIADLWISRYFGNEINGAIYRDVMDHIIKGKSQFPEKKIKEYLQKAEELKHEKGYFHWELEFPEIYFDKFGRVKDNPGFDAVIGNPPYDVISEKEQEKEVEADKIYFENQKYYQFATGGKLNFYRLFAAKAVDILRNGGRHGFIVPMSLLGDEQAKGLRKFLLFDFCLEIVEAFPQKDDPGNRVFKEAKLPTCLYIARKDRPNRFWVRVHPGKEILETSSKLNFDGVLIKKFDPENLSIPAYPGMKMEDFNLALKLNETCAGNNFKAYAQSQQGEVNLTAHKRFLTKKPEDNLVLRGAHINRYEFNEEPKQGEEVFLKASDFLKSHGPDTKAYDYTKKRIGYQRGSAIDNWRRIIATIIEPNNFCSDTINYIVDPKQVGLFFVLAILNSSLFEWRFRLTSTNNHVNAYEIDSLPVPSINLTTPKGEREKIFNELKNTYEIVDFKMVLEKVDACLLKKRLDIVSDLLAFLAEKMVETNKDKQKEVKSFVEWLEREIETKSDELLGKTIIKEYFKGENTFDRLIEMLKKNRSKLSIDPSRREFQDKLKNEYNKSLAKLNPLLQKIQDTDNLLNQIVYELYGLTKEEIKVVGGVDS